MDWAVDGDTATAGADYTDGSGTLTFAPGDTTKTVTVATLPDTDPEGAETFTVTLSNASNATIADADADATGTIAANDAVLTALALSGATLVPAFDSATTEYEANAASTVENTMVTATPNPAGAAVVIKLGGTVDARRDGGPGGGRQRHHRRGGHRQHLHGDGDPCGGGDRRSGPSPGRSHGEHRYGERGNPGADLQRNVERYLHSCRRGIHGEGDP